MDFDCFNSSWSKIFLIKACSLTITKSRHVDIFSFRKFDTAVGRQNEQTTQFVSSQLIGFFLLNFCFVKISSSLNRLNYFSASHFFRMSMTNFSSHENIFLNENLSFLA